MDEKQNELTYRIFLTEAIRAFTGFKPRYLDMVIPDDAPVDTRTPEEVISNISAKLSQLGGE